jgi:hypothetical protein
MGQVQSSWLYVCIFFIEILGRVCMLYLLIGIGIAEICPIENTSREWKSSDMASCQTEVTEYCSSRKGSCFKLCHKLQIKYCHEQVKSKSTNQRSRRSTRQKYEEPIVHAQDHGASDYEMIFEDCVQAEVMDDECAIYCSDPKYAPLPWGICEKLKQEGSQPKQESSQLEQESSSGMCSSISFSSSLWLGMVGFLTVAYRREG